MGKMKKLKEQPAYAGSRVDYDIPSLEKIGSGEGNQAHGWGLYYAKSKKVANDYYKTFKKQTPSHFEYNGKNMYIALQDMLDIEFMNGETLEVIIKTSEKAKSISELKELLVVNLTKLNKKYKYNVNEKNKVEQAIKIIPTLNDNEFSIIKPQLHQVELPEDEYLLNEQEMLIDQSEYVQIIIYKINKELGLGIEDSGIRGLKIYELISDKLGSDKKASLYLNKKGIKGISYDGRQDGRCFVIFNPDDVKVVDKLIKEEQEIDEQPAYAGSRVDYDVPSLNAIGSGEGHVAHGWGLYYAQSKDVADDYRISFVGKNKIKYKGKIYTYDMPEFQALYKLANRTISIEQIKQDYKENLKEIKDELKWATQYNIRQSIVEYSKMLEDLKKEIKFFNSLSEKDVEEIKYAGGQVHQVELPEDEFLLDEQKPLKEQSEYVKNILYKVLSQLDMTKHIKKEYLDNLTGEDIYKTLCVEIGSSTTNGKKAASLFLYKNGIKGITYDGRVDGRCYVIFNPDDVKVVDKLIKEQTLDEQLAYCGALKPFNKADIKLIGKGNKLLQHGYGFYFTVDKETADFYRRGHTLNGLTGGAIMTVELPDDKYFIDEDKEEQSEYVYKRLIKLYNSKILSKEIVERNKKLNLDPISGTGKEIYEEISDNVGGSKKASELLAKFGIKGITYVSRTDGKCFVIFSPNDIKIIEKQDFTLKEQTAYAGSKEDYDTPSLEKVGVSSGFKYGWGLYYSKSPKTAENYYKIYTSNNDISYKGKIYNKKKNDREHFCLSMIKMGSSIEDMLNQYGNDPKVAKLLKNMKPENVKDIKTLGGQIVKVDLPEDKYFMDWTLPFDKQSDIVKKGILGLIDTFPKEVKGKLNDKEVSAQEYFMSLNGEYTYDVLKNFFKQDYQKASQELNRFGIKGIKYNDESDGECFVVFNDKDVKVVDKLIKESVQYVNNIEVLVNPSNQELNQILRESKEKELRIIYHLALGDFYAWDSSYCVHSEMATNLGIEWNTNDNFYLVYDYHGFHMRTRSESEFLISDYQEYKEIANEIDYMQVFKQYTQRLSAFDNLIQDIKEYLEYFPQKLNMEHIYNKKNYNEIIKDLDLQTINESAESDLKQRNEAKEIFKEISKKIKNKNTDILISERICFIDITNEIKKIINQDNRKHFIRFVFSGDESVFSYNVSIGNKDTMFTFPILEKPVLELITKLVNKSKSNIEKYYQVMNDSNKKMEFIKDLLRKYIVSHIKLKLEYDFPVFIHEIIHYLDDIRRTSTYKPKAQTFNSKQDYIDYYNNPIEQNAYYQETISIFDDWIENKWLNDDNLGSSWKDFEKFYSEFVRQYRGRYDILSDKNKHKIMKRAYLYWKSKISATVNEGYVKRTGKHPIYGVEYNDDYIDYEVGMRYIDDKGIEWEIIKTSGEGDDKIILVQDENGKINHTDQMMLNIHIMDDEDDFRMIFDPKYFSDEDIKNSEN